MPTIAAGYYNAPIFSEIDVAPGTPNQHAFADATYSMIIGERKSANLIVKPRFRTDWLERTFLDMMDAEVDVELYENDLIRLYNWVLMGKQGLSQWRFKTADGKFWNFVPNTGTPLGTPVGTWELGVAPIFEVGDTERSIKIKATGGGYRQEYKNLAAIGGSGNAGSTGGNAITGFVHTAYDNTAIAPPGIISMAVGGDSVPFIEKGSKITLDFGQKAYSTSPRHQPLPNFVGVKVEINTYNSDLANTQVALEALINSDTTFTLTLPPTPGDITAGRANPTIVLASSTFLNAEPNLVESGEAMTKIMLTGGAPLDSPAWNATNVVFVTGAGNSLTINRIGVA